LGLVKRAGGTKIPAGEKLRFKILKAVEDEGDHGPQIRLFNVAMACFEGNAKFLDSMESIEDLADALDSKSFVSITKARGKNGDYTGITGAMIYVDQTAAKKAAKQANDENLDDVAFGDPPPAF
jgi:hypothetical protein